MLQFVQQMFSLKFHHCCLFFSDLAKLKSHRRLYTDFAQAESCSTVVCDLQMDSDMLNWWRSPLNPILVGTSTDPELWDDWIWPWNSQYHGAFIPRILSRILHNLTLSYDASSQEDEGKMLLTWPVVLKPNSRGQDTAKARTHTVAIIIKTLFRERWVVLYKTGITTAVYLHMHMHRLEPSFENEWVQGIHGDIWMNRKVLI